MESHLPMQVCNKTWVPDLSCGDGVFTSVVIEDVHTGTKSCINVLQDEWTNPVSELLADSTLDVLPG